MKVRKIIKTALPFFVILALFLACAFYQDPARAEAERQVVLVWNVDTFEGGKGSRTSFLKRAARRAEKERTGTYYLVSSYTAEGAKQAFAEGNYPDMLSFGVGIGEGLERALPLSRAFRGGEVDGKTLAYPWCAGSYYLFCLEETFGEEGSVAISCGGENFPQIAAALAGVEGEELPSLTAYARFLGGQYRYLLGTQRDICRFAARGVNVYTRRLDGFCDLFQYISIFSAEKREACTAFLEELLSERTQEELGDIGMFPVRETRAERTVLPFLSDGGRGELLALVRERKNPEKYLKTI